MTRHGLPSRGGRRWRRTGAVLDDLHVFEGDEAFLHHLVEEWEEGLYAVGGIHDFDDDRQVHGEAEYFGGMKAGVSAEAHGTAEHGGAGHTQLACFQDDGFVEGLVLPAIVFADEDPEEFGVAWGFHGLPREGLAHCETQPDAGEAESDGETDVEEGRGPLVALD